MNHKVTKGNSGTLTNLQQLKMESEVHFPNYVPKPCSAIWIFFFFQTWLDPLKYKVVEELKHYCDMQVNTNNLMLGHTQFWGLTLLGAWAESTFVLFNWSSLEDIFNSLNIKY